MRKLFFVLMLLICTLSACSKNDEVYSSANENDIQFNEIAVCYLEDFFNQNVSEMLDDYELTKDLGNYFTAEVYAEIYNTLVTTYGEYIEICEISETEKDGYIVVTSVCKFEGRYLNMIVVFEENGIIAGFRYNENNTYIEEGEHNEYVFFGEDEYKIRGKLTLPKGEGPFPAIIIVHGSGASDMDGSVYSLKPYKDIAEYLKNEGIAVLRYDKRTFSYGAKFKDIFSEFTVYEETIDDVIYAYEFLMSQSKISSDNIYIAGHSLGGYLMPRIAEKIPLAKGYIYLAASVSSFEDLTLAQIIYLCNLDDKITDEEKSQIAVVEEMRNIIKNIDEYKDNKEIVNAFGSGYSYWYDLKDYNPVELAKNIEKPMLFLQGERDYQVTLSEFRKWQKGLSSKDNVSFITYEKVNHMLMESEGILDATVSEMLMDDIISFINNNQDLKEEK